MRRVGVQAPASRPHIHRAALQQTQQQVGGTQHDSLTQSILCRSLPLALVCSVFVSLTRIELHRLPCAVCATPAVLSSIHCTARRFDFSPSQLKSLLQKNIRMSRPMAAVRSALQLAVRAGLSELLRRLSVIMVEDAILHPHTPLLLWLTLVCAEKRKEPHGGSLSNVTERREDKARAVGKDGAAENRAMCHPPTLQLLNAVLLLVFDIAAVAVKDSYQQQQQQQQQGAAQADQAQPRSPPSPPLSLSLADADYADVSGSQLLYVRCLLLRAHLGGMDGDMTLLRRFAALWLRRFAAENKQTAAAAGDSTKAAPRRWLPFLQQLFQHSADRHTHNPHTRAGAGDGGGAAGRQKGGQQALSALSVGCVQDEDILLSAIDQHCSPLIDQLRADGSRVKEHIAQHVHRIAQHRADGAAEAACADEEAAAAVSESRVDVVRLLNAAIWRHRSSLTNKRPLVQPSKHAAAAAAIASEQPDSDASYQLFQIIKAEADQISRRIVAQKLRR